VKRARKDAFKSSSSSVKLQEELKSAKASLKALQVNYESEKMRSGNREQEAFQAQYQLVGVQEQLANTQDELLGLREEAERTRLENERMRERCKVLEEEREGLKRSLEEEEVARIAAEGRIALPAGGDDDEFDLLLMEPSPKKMAFDGEKSPSKKGNKGKQREILADASDSEKENVLPVPKKSAMQVKSLQQDLAVERRLRIKAQDQVEFMKMECHFGCCSCRIAEQSGSVVMAHSKAVSPVAEPRGITMQMEASAHASEVDMMDVQAEIDEEELQVRHASTPDPVGLVLRERDDSIAVFEGHSTVIIDRPRKERRSTRHVNSVIYIDDESHTLLASESTPEPATDDHSLPHHSIPTTPNTEPEYAVRTITTTTTIPMMFSPQKPASTYPASAVSTPKSTYDARSLPNTPRTVSHLSQYQDMLDENDAANGGASAFKPDGTLDREAALEMIRQRRGRARSVAMGQATPGKGKVQGAVAGSRRDVTR
jgi:hypothetical protein